MCHKGFRRHCTRSGDRDETHTPKLSIEEVRKEWWQVRIFEMSIMEEKQARIRLWTNLFSRDSATIIRKVWICFLPGLSSLVDLLEILSRHIFSLTSLLDCCYLSLSLFLSFSLSLSLPFSRSLSLVLFLCFSFSLSLFLSLSIFLFLSPSFSLSFSLSLSHGVSSWLSLRDDLSLSLRARSLFLTLFLSAPQQPWCQNEIRFWTFPIAKILLIRCRTKIFLRTKHAPNHSMRKQEQGKRKKEEWFWEYNCILINILISDDFDHPKGRKNDPLYWWFPSRTSSKYHIQSWVGKHFLICFTRGFIS